MCKKHINITAETDPGILLIHLECLVDHRHWSQIKNNESLYKEVISVIKRLNELVTDDYDLNCLADHYMGPNGFDAFFHFKEEEILPTLKGRLA